MLDLLPDPLLPDPLLDLLPLLVIAVGDLVDLLLPVDDSPLPAFDRLRWYRAYVGSHSNFVAVVATMPLITSDARMVLDFIIDS